MANITRATDKDGDRFGVVEGKEAKLAFAIGAAKPLVSDVHSVTDNLMGKKRIQRVEWS